jgi:hypothetical protein
MRRKLLALPLYVEVSVELTNGVIASKGIRQVIFPCCRSGGEIPPTLVDMKAGGIVGVLR